jgi:Flp pilus assembly protein protease CpaA
MDTLNIGKWLMVAGGVLLLAGAILFFLGKMGISPGKLPGDIRFQSGNVTILIPIATSLLISLILTVGLNVLIRLLKK